MRPSSDGVRRHLRLVGAQDLPGDLSHGLSNGMSHDLSTDLSTDLSNGQSTDPSGKPGAVDTSDSDLVEAFRIDPTAASAALWDRYYPFVRRVLVRAMGPGHDVDDLVQEVFLRLYRKLPSLREPAALRGFVLAISTRVLQGELRVRWVRRWLRLWDEGKEPEQSAVEVDRDAREALDRLYRILDGLPARHRTAFVLRHIENLELVDVAAGLGVSLATTKRWLTKISRRVVAQAKQDPILATYLQEGRDSALTHG